MASIAENISNLSIDEGAEILKMHTYGLKVKGVKQVLKSDVENLPKVEERDVNSKLLKYKDSIEKLKVSCSDVLNASECDPEVDLIYDDLFILRYVLSKKNDLKKAEAAIRECCRWRADPDVRKSFLGG